MCHAPKFGFAPQSYRERTCNKMLGIGLVPLEVWGSFSQQNWVLGWECSLFLRGDQVRRHLGQERWGAHTFPHLFSSAKSSLLMTSPHPRWHPEFQDVPRISITWSTRCPPAKRSMWPSPTTWVLQTIPEHSSLPDLLGGWEGDPRSPQGSRNFMWLNEHDHLQQPLQKHILQVMVSWLCCRKAIFAQSSSMVSNNFILKSGQLD